MITPFVRFHVRHINRFKKIVLYNDIGIYYKVKCGYSSKINVKTSDWKSVVGLEIHAQIKSNSKLFSGAGTEFGSPVNSNVSLFDAAVPGTLPVVNRRCIEAGVFTALALSCTVNPVSLFDRKHYFYADLPAGYQITQQRLPLAEAGELQFYVFNPNVNQKPYLKKSCIKQLQLEQDSGRSLHDEEASRSLIDLNRAGIPLMELVFEPDLENGEEAASLVKELMLILHRLGTCSCKMEEGALRVDANVSVHKPGEPLGTRSEVKNIGSVRALANAVQYEIDRQIQALEAGEVIVNETRSWDSENQKTVSMRDKEEKQDYRYMPEPNLPPLRVILDDQFPVQDTYRDLVNVNALRKELPELPNETRKKLTDQYGVSSESAVVLVNEDDLLRHFFCIMEKQNRDPRIATNILIMELLTVLNKNKMSLQTSALSSNFLGEIVDLLQSKTVNLVTARKLLQELVSGTPKSPREVVEMHGWSQISDVQEIEQICAEVLQQNSKLVNQFHGGKTKVFNALVGQVSNVTNKRANMAVVVEVLKKMLNTKKES